MTTHFYITPYPPAEWEERTTDLVINPAHYKELLFQKWPNAKIFKETSTVLAFGILMPNSEVYIYGRVKKFWVCLETRFEEFFLWHRSVIPSDYQLFLFRTSSWDALELKLDTTIEEVKAFFSK